MPQKTITIRGARQHNLKNVDLDLPRNRLVVVTGLSGSGKSTLAFDTLYAEGQRRYVESLSTYARQFLERLAKPDVDMIEGLSPAIAIEQKSASHNPRSTVGTVTEIYDFLRLLFARAGIAHCHECDRPITAQTAGQIQSKVFELPADSRIQILAPLLAREKGDPSHLIERLRKDGFSRVRVDETIFDIESTGSFDADKPHSLEVVVDRLVVKDTMRNRFADSLELALALSDGTVIIDVLDQAPLVFTEKPVCIKCGVSYPPFTPASFSFNSPHGACPHCDGLGSKTEFDEDLIVPNPALSLREGAIIPWANRSTVHFTDFLDALTRHYKADIYTPYQELPPAFRQVLMHGSGKEEIPFYFEKQNRRHIYKKTFEGVIPQLQRRYLETDSHSARKEIKRFMTFRPCPGCHGTRLNPPGRAVRVAGKTLAQITAMPIIGAIAFFSQMKLTGQRAVVAEKILKEISGRLRFLDDVGLSYLTLNRSAATLSGGESQRIRLATQIGSKLTGVLYVLDEPSIGLHQRDNQRLLTTLLAMRDMGNTILVVEHDEETIRAADHVVDMGPGAGMHGGRVVFSGPPEALVASPASLTGQYLSGQKCIALPTRRRPGNGRCLALKGARANNLKKLDVEFPLGCFICVTGVSGSGKSTLVLETLHALLARHLHYSRIPAGHHLGIEGLQYVDKVVNIDQAPIGKTPRSNPGTYTGVFSHIREMFAKTAEARVRGFKPGRFSFNVKGGRCEACRGDGVVKIEMHFLPDIYVPCDACEGKRYNRETLEVRYKGKTIVDVLDMTVNQAMAFFKNVSSIRPKLQTLIDVGIGYIHLGQPATTLSGGEAQRIKLARELSKRSTGRTVYILDEPTTGLHADDIRNLLAVLNRFVDAGNTVIVIEHNLDVIKTADHVIDLGPEGGDMGGEIIGTGTPEVIAGLETSHTGRFLKRVLQV